VQLKREDDHAKLTVRDTGEGIPKDELPHMFEKFYTIKGARTRSDEGSGVGLSLIEDLVKLHGGTISLESTVGKGTTLTVRIPFGKDHLPQKQVISSDKGGDVSDHLHKAFVYEAARWVANESESVTSAPDATEATILVVDDNSDMRYYIKSILDQTKGWKTVLAPDGMTALQLTREVKPDIILSDIMMPQMSGHELVKNLRADGENKTTPVIFLSARAGEEAENTGMASGVDDYLVKPFTANELVARVNAHLKLSLNRKRAHEEEMQKLRELDEAKTQFLHQVSQLLSGPTSIVKQYTRVLIRDHTNNLTGDQHRILEKIYESNEMNMTIVENLLKDTAEGTGKGRL
jgi:DNA-binding response OmpR family regulator